MQSVFTLIPFLSNLITLSSNLCTYLSNLDLLLHPSHIQQLINLGVVLGLVQVSNYLNLEDPEHLIKLRISYVISQLINLILLLYITRKIAKNNDSTPLTYTDPKTPFASAYIKSF